jgi:phosphoribosylformimino-5-aminoimidazole carboxamide ribotide isomerase
VIPAIDIRDGACVQLVGGAFDREALRIADPLVAAARWRAAGFTALHVVDLDAAVTGDRRVNRSMVRDLVSFGMRAQVGGGIRDTEAVEDVLTLGAERVVVGTRALQDPDWLDRVATRRPGGVVAAVDVAGGRPLVDGWRETATRSLDDALAAVRGLPLAGLLVTAVDVEGRMVGPDLGLYRRVLARGTPPLIASGGIGSLDHLRQLRDIGVSAVVVGMALYTGALDARATAEEFAA